MVRGLMASMEPVYEPGAGGYTNYVGGGYHQAEISPDPGDGLGIDPEARRIIRDLQIEVEENSPIDPGAVRRDGTELIRGAKTFANIVIISNGTASTGANTGALQVKGGAWFGGNSYFTGTLFANNGIRVPSTQVTNSRIAGTGSDGNAFIDAFTTGSNGVYICWNAGTGGLIVGNGAGGGSGFFVTSGGACTATSFFGSGSGLTSIPVTALSATGRTSSNFLRGDGTWATPAGGSVSATTTCLSVVDQGMTLTLTAGSVSNTCGIIFYVGAAVNCAGVRFYGVAGKSYKLSLWAGGSRIATVTVGPLASTGVTTGTFASPVALSLNTSYGLSTWETGGTTYTWYNKNNILWTWPMYINPWVLLKSMVFASGDANPTSGTSTEGYLLEPILS